jgi:UDP-glucose 4-epimerase
LTYDKVLVTGGAGFIGSHTVDALLNEGRAVWVLDNLSTGSLRNLRTWKRNPRFHLRKSSTLHHGVVEELARKVDAVLHLAAIVSPYLSVKKPEIVNAVNVSGTLSVLRASLRNKVQKFVFASSSSVYGNQDTSPISEANLLGPITPYGASKVSGEKYCEAFFRSYGLNVVSLRYFNVFGERQSANPYSGVIAIFTGNLGKGLRPVIYGDGEQTRDFIHVSDVVRANLLALETKRGMGEALNIGTGKPTSITKLHTLVASLFERPDIAPIYRETRPGDVRHSCADPTKAGEVLGFRSSIELKHGLELLVHSH